MDKIFRYIRNSKRINIRFIEQKDFEISIMKTKTLGAFISKTKNGWVKFQSYGWSNNATKKVVELK